MTIIHRIWTASTGIAKLEIMKCKHHVSRNATLTFALEYNSGFFLCLYTHVLGDFNCSLVDIAPVYIKHMLEDKIQYNVGQRYFFIATAELKICILFTTCTSNIHFIIV